jgi:hypothetical protein
MTHSINFTWSGNDQEYNISVPFTFSSQNVSPPNIIQLMLGESILVNDYRLSVNGFTRNLAANMFEELAKEEKLNVCQHYKTAFVSVAKIKYIDDKSKELADQIYEKADQELADQYSNLLMEMNDLNFTVSEMIHNFMEKNMAS